MKEFLDISEWLGMPEAASAHAPEIDFMMALVHWLMLLLFVGWGIYYIYVLIRFRKSKQPNALYEGTKAKYSTYQESGIVVVEAVLLVVFAFPIWGFLKNEFPPAEESVEVHVIAEQFAWNFHYPGEDGVFGRRDINLIDLATNPVGLDMSDPAAQDDITSVNEMHLPVNRPIIIQLSSKDVIHSFALPHMRVKQDAIPGLVIPIWFRPTKTGDYEISCAQLCGLSHYRMRGFLTVHTQEAYDAWLVEALELQREFM
ncbi:MAG: cytochrome c oxidase subunit II [Rhodothermales bacterium]|nr:cytochrome c oxidase subunit II [Rhodothermales bacterium]